MAPAAQLPAWHGPLARSLRRKAAQRCALAAPACARGRINAAPRPGHCQLSPIARRAEMPSPRAHFCPAARRFPPREAAGLNFPGRVARCAPGKRAHPLAGRPPRTSPRPWSTAPWLRRCDFAFAAERHSERCAQEAVGRRRCARSGCKSPGPCSRHAARRACRTTIRNRTRRGPVVPRARTNPLMPAWLPGAAEPRRVRLCKPRLHPRRGSSPGIAWRDPDAC